ADVLTGRGDEALPVAGVLQQCDREGVRLSDLVRLTRSDRDLRVHERLDRVALAVKRPGGRPRQRDAADGQGRGRMAGHLARSGRGEHDLALPGRVRIRTGVVAGARRRVQHALVPYPTLYRSADVLTGRGDEALPVAGVLQQCDREGVRLSDLVRLTRSD